MLNAINHAHTRAGCEQYIRSKDDNFARKLGGDPKQPGILQGQEVDGREGERGPKDCIEKCRKEQEEGKYLWLVEGGTDCIFLVNYN